MSNVNILDLPAHAGEIPSVAGFEIHDPVGGNKHVTIDQIRGPSEVPGGGNSGQVLIKTGPNKQDSSWGNVTGLDFSALRASPEETEAGFDNTKFATPLGVKTAIDAIPVPTSEDITYRDETISDALDKMTFYASDRATAEVLASGLGDGATVWIDNDEANGGIRTRNTVVDGVLTSAVSDTADRTQASGGVTVQDKLDTHEARLGVGGRTHPRNGVLCWIGDSITDPSSYLNGASAALYGAGSLYEGWTVYNSAMNGSRLQDWVNSIPSGNQSAPPLNGSDATTNVWRLKNADPDEIVIMLGTNDIRKFTNYPNLAAAEAGMQANLKVLVDWLLHNTTATIELQTPPPLTYISGSVTGFCDFVDAADAAARNAMIRRIYRYFRGYSARVDVFDLHRALFAAGTADASLRWDSLAASVDPDSAGTVIKVDELHLTPWGECLRAFAMHRRRDMTVPYKSTMQRPWTSLHQNLALRSMRAVIKAVGAGYIDIYSDISTSIFGTNQPASTLRGPLNNLPVIGQMTVVGAAAMLTDFLRAPSFKIYDSTGAVTTITPSAVTHNNVDGYAGDYYRLTVSGTPTTALGLADLYIDAQTNLPPSPAQYDAVDVLITGAAGQGRKNFALTGRKMPINVNTIQATRQSNSGAATIDVYFQNVWNGSYFGAAGTIGAPGYKLGTLTFASGYVLQTTWAADPTNFPGGTASMPDAPSAHAALYAVVTSGTVGDWATVTLKG